MAIDESVQPISPMSSLQKLNFALSITMAVTILFFYYSFMYSIPMPPNYWLNWFWKFFYFELRIDSMGILLNIPIVYAALTMDWKRSVLYIMALLICVTPYILTFSFSGSSLFLSFATLILPFIIIICTRLWLESRAREKRTGAEREALRITSLRQKYKVQEEERKRMAQELHDGVIQTSLINASIVRDLVLTHAEKTGDVLEKELRNVENNSVNIANDIRSICQNLRPSILDNLGLIPAVRSLADHIRGETGITLSLSFKGSFDKLTSDENVVFFRLIQESLTNIRRHSQARTVSISMQYIEERVSVEITDDGKGFELPGNVNSLAKTGQLGIIGMSERAQSIGAILQIDSKIGVGTTVRILLERHP